MCNKLDEHSKCIDELYRYIELTEHYLSKLEKRVAELEKHKDYSEYKEYPRW